jgi:hypothetical protein
MRLVATWSAAVVGAFVACLAISAAPAAAAPPNTSRLTVLGVEVSTSGALYPGARADVIVEVRNPNRVDVTVTSIVAGDVDSDDPRCGEATGVRFIAQYNRTDPVPASSTTRILLTGALSMDNSTVDACQAATLRIPLTVSAVGTADLSEPSPGVDEPGDGADGSDGGSNPDTDLDTGLDGGLDSDSGADLGKDWFAGWLPKTGAPIGLLAGSGLVLLTGGAAMVVLARRRGEPGRHAQRRTTASDTPMLYRK